MTDTSLMSEPMDSRSAAPGPDTTASYAGFGARRSRWGSLTDPASHLLTFIGIGIAAIGFALIGIAWAKVAGLTQVWQQVPYVLSAGLPGLGLVMTGLVVINVSARRQDAAARARQMETLAEALNDLRRSLR